MHMNDIGLELLQASAHRLFGGKTVYAAEKGPNITQSHTRDLGTAATEITNLMAVFCKQSRKALHHSLFTTELAVFVVDGKNFHKIIILT